ncbi:MAG: hypothetical protein EZS28_001331 [Streblomastix strix]|uniref:Uncharacterized protein n=1 Tax=Streblomastix strix TaxID=222440 RepID=A0A5J4X7X4_9EUKA|nr:MAG: hypothetical protein EZS28_001331 [Streblomastix strix]
MYGRHGASQDQEVTKVPVLDHPINVYPLLSDEFIVFCAQEPHRIPNHMRHIVDVTENQLNGNMSFQSQLQLIQPHPPLLQPINQQILPHEPMQMAFLQPNSINYSLIQIQQTPLIPPQSRIMSIGPHPQALQISPYGQQVQSQSQLPQLSPALRPPVSNFQPTSAG